jgi:ABC-type antimicrobial peptide transport system permease subunit
VLSVLFVRSATDALGFTAPYVYPWLWVPGVGVLALLIGGLGAIAPARRASRLDVVTALAYE